MLIVQVHVYVKKDMKEQFIEATIKNALKSIQEPGIARFDIIQQNSEQLRSFGISGIGLFGSYVNNRENENSPIRCLLTLLEAVLCKFVALILFKTHANIAWAVMRNPCVGCGEPLRTFVRPHSETSVDT